MLAKTCTGACPLYFCSESSVLETQKKRLRSPDVDFVFKKVSPDLPRRIRRWNFSPVAIQNVLSRDLIKMKIIGFEFGKKKCLQETLLAKDEVQRSSLLDLKRMFSFLFRNRGFVYAAAS